MVEQVNIQSLLIADDEDVHRATLKVTFERLGFQTYVATNGEEALAVLDEHVVDCLLLDIHMPVLSGLEVLEMLRQMHLDRNLPAILLTADSSEAVMKRALALQAFSVLTKPISRELVTACVRRALRSVANKGA